MHTKLAIVLVVIVVAVTCKPAPLHSPNAEITCKLPEVRGRCRALMPRWRYDLGTGKCREFNFGGCDGNGNNFMSERACMNVCAGVEA